jgi:regulator of protease activity HflC (stomatin/prohibitin superfamily)
MEKKDELEKVPCQASGMGVESHDDDLNLAQENSPAYRTLIEHNLVTSRFRIRNAAELDMDGANSSLSVNYVKRFLCGVACLPYECCAASNFMVDDGNIMPAMRSNEYVFYGPGVHRVIDPFTSIERQRSLKEEIICWGNRTIVTVPQGYIGLCEDRGQPVLLPPGMHQWKSDTLKWLQKIDLANHVIELGPWTLVTVDEGYAAVTQDNGRQVILEGGTTHMLTHRQWKFEKFISQKIQTNDLEKVEATTGDNVVLSTSATVNWLISDVALAARMAAETMKSDGMPMKGGDIEKLRLDVLKQAQASLSCFIGTVRYGSAVDTSAAIALGSDGKGHGKRMSDRHQSGAGATMGGMENLYDVARLQNAVDHANSICNRYGVSIISINIISAVPIDKRLQEALAKGAVASAEAEQAEVAASGNARALLIKTQSEADAQIVSAKATAESARIRAAGETDAARTLETSSIAVELARIEHTGNALNDKATFFFGTGGPSEIPSLLANPGITSKPQSSAGGIWGR